MTWRKRQMFTNRNLVAWVLLFVFVFLSSPTWSAATGRARGQVNCKAGSVSLATAKATWDRQTKHLRIQIYKTPQDTKQFVDLTLMLTTDSGRVDRDKIDAYHMYLRCPEMQYNDNVTVHAFFNRDEFYQRFPHFSADLRKGGKVNIAFRGATKGPWEGLSWDFSVAATLP